MASPTRRILTLNSGSSSVKFSVYELGDAETLLLSGKLDGTALRAKDQNGKELVHETLSISERRATVEYLLQWLRRNQLLEGITGLGYRIVHGGNKHSEPERLTPALLEDLKKLIPLAPDHLPDQILVIEAVSHKEPDLAAVACFDTAFHRQMPRVAQLYGLTRELAEQGLIRYGFHGLSYAFLVEELRRENALPERLVIAHLGNGASMAAIRNGVSVDTSMGFTPTGGFPMSTRSGDLDPSILLYLLQQKNWTSEAVNQLVEQQGGLQGLSGISADVRELEKQSLTNPVAAETLDVFCYGIRKFLGAYIAVLGGLDLLVFTGGIGENSALVRQKVCEGLTALGIELEAERNERNAPVISTGASPTTVRVMPTNEELMIARNTYMVLSQAE